MNTRFIKVIRDLSTDYGKNAMLALAIGIGIFGIGTILGSRAVINREMARNYMSTVPASATIECEKSISAGLLDSVRTFPGIKHAERRATVVARMFVNERWYPILLFVVDDFQDFNISKFHYLSGDSIPADGSMLVERTALDLMNLELGKQIKIRPSNGDDKMITIAGAVHDPGLAPAWQEQAGYAYISLPTLKMLGETQGFDLLRILVDENSTQGITSKAELLSDWLTSNGHKVHEIQIPPPGKHPHQSQMNAVLSIFTIFSFMTLLLGSILVGTSMATIMLRHIRQIGVMKTIGGTSFQIAQLYIFMILVISLVALIISIPLSRLAAYGFNSQLATLLNLEIIDSSIPYWIPLIQTAAGILIPLIAALFPVIKGSRMSIRSALDSHGVANNISANAWSTRLTGAGWVSDTFRISLRNVLRQRTRLALTVGLLAAGGAMFMMALNLSDAWDKNLERIYIQRLYDLEIRFSGRIAPDSIISKISHVEGVKSVEGWDFAPTSFVTSGGYEITKTYPDKGHGSFTMLALPVSSRFLNPTILEGRWLSRDGSNEVVLNQGARPDDKKIGDTISLSIDGLPTSWKIIGFTEDVGTHATAYVSIVDFSKVVGTVGKIRELRVAYTDRSRENAIHKNQTLEQLFEVENIDVSSSIPVWLLRNAVAGHMRVLINSLLAMALLMGIVGSIGLLSTTSMNVLERTREIGVMRAIGATPKTIRNIIVWEVLTVGILSILAAFGMSLPLSYYMGEFIGAISFRTPLSLTISIVAIAIWVAVILIGSTLASLYPAKKANRITTWEALAYE
ncbi:MAG: FtsX-like permease family protein [Chryseolinea sp.]